MKRFKYFPLYFVVFFCMSIIGHKFNLVIRGTPIGGHSWIEIWKNLPFIFIISAIFAFYANYFMNQIRKRQINDISKAEELMVQKEKYRSAPKTHECRVCGCFSEEYPWGEDGKSPSFQICPCCGVQFGVGDITPEDIQKYSAEWAKRNYKWFEPSKKPADWLLEDQIKDTPQIG